MLLQTPRRLCEAVRIFIDYDLKSFHRFTFFECRNIIKQLISRFQRTSFTPRHHAVLNTPGNSISKGVGPSSNHGPSPSQNGGNQGHAMINDCMMQLQSASIASIGGVGAFSEDPCLFNQQFSSMDSLDSNIFEVLISLDILYL